MRPLFEDRGESLQNKRAAEFAIDPLFINRWSPRAFDPTPIPEDIIKTVFEAARWSPSCYNDQPWLFLYATTEDELKIFRGLLAEFNQQWTKNAPVVGFLFARRRFAHDDKPNDWAVFDCGAAWMGMALQARMLGLYTHAMAGFDIEKTYETLGVSKDDYQVVCAFTIGMYGDRDKLPEDMKERETPNDRNPLSKMIIKGTAR
jgi:nitroreductase